MEKTRLENDVTGRISLVYAKIKIESWLLEPIWLSVVYDENQIGQWRDRSYMCNLQRK